MKPAQLKCPFSWEQRHVTVHDRVWYVPLSYDRYETFSFPGWDHPNLFVRNQPIHIEYCSGNGAWIAEKAQNNPGINWVAVEMDFDRVRKIWAKIKNFALDNLLVVSAEGWTMTRHYVPSETVEQVYINFPDPWPKTRHAKHRIVQNSFVQEVWRILKPGGSFTLVTDDAAYSAWMINVLSRCSGFASYYPSPYYQTELPDYGSSYFEDLWRGKGKEIRYHQYHKR